jgi:hypothetical protein
MRRTWKIGAALVVAFLAGAFMVTALALPAGVTKISARGSTKVAIARGSTSNATTSGSWVNLPSASVLVTVPKGQKAVMVATFSGETICSGGVVADECDLRIMWNKKEGLPGPAAPNSGAAFDSVGTSGADYREMHAVQRSLGPLSPGRYTIQVQWETCCGTTFTLSDWTLTVESFRV